MISNILLYINIVISFIILVMISYKSDDRVVHCNHQDNTKDDYLEDVELIKAEIHCLKQENDRLKNQIKNKNNEISNLLTPYKING